MKLSQEQLKEILPYDPETGIWTWKKSINSRAQIDHQAGSLDRTSTKD